MQGQLKRSRENENYRKLKGTLLTAKRIRYSLLPSYQEYNRNTVILNEFVRLESAIYDRVLERRVNKPGMYTNIDAAFNRRQKNPELNLLKHSQRKIRV